MSRWANWNFKISSDRRRERRRYKNPFISSSQNMFPRNSFIFSLSFWIGPPTGIADINVVYFCVFRNFNYQKTFSLFLGALSSIGRGPHVRFFPQFRGGWSRSWPFELRSLLVNRPVFKLLYILYDISWSACRFVARRHRVPHLSPFFFFDFKLCRSDLLLIWKLLSYGWSLLLLLWYSGLKRLKRRFCGSPKIWFLIGQAQAVNLRITHNDSGRLN